MKRLALLIIVLAAAVAAGYWSLRAPARRVPILLVTIDTMRADAIGHIGGGTHTPVMDGLIREGVLFADAATAAPTTGPSHASILSGEFPFRHGYRNNGQQLPEALSWLPSTLHDAGYATAAFVSGFPLDHMFGFARGFDHYDDDFGRAPGNRFALSERSAEATTRAAMEWLSGAGSKPWFAWVHYYDPHAPYAAPSAYAQDGPRGDYLAEVAYVDHWLGELVASARRQDPDVVVIVTSDHGEGLGEHDEYDHGMLLYQSTVRIPLIFSAPGRFKAHEDPHVARSVDIAPTVLALAGLPVAANSDGIDLQGLLNGRDADIPPAYSETFFASATYGFAPLRSLRSGAAKRIEGAHARFFDLASDPAEAVPLDAVQAGVPAARLESLLARVPLVPPGKPASGSTDAEAMARLRSLGYLGAGTSLDQQRWDPAIDPEDHLAEHNELLRAQETLDRGDLVMAQARYQAILSLSPDNRVAWLRLGGIQRARGDQATALASLGRAVELDPLNAEAHYQLAQLLTEARRYAEAIAHWEVVTSLQPARAAAWSNLGTCQWFSGLKDAALKSLEKAVQVAPKDATLRENLARLQLQSGRDSGAIESLIALAEIEPARFGMAGVLAERLARSGRVEESEQWLARSRPGQEAYADAHVALAIALFSLDRAKAADHLREALRADPRRTPAIMADPELAALLK